MIALLLLLLAQDVSFEASAPQSAPDVMRVRLSASDKIPDWDVKPEKFRLVVPKSLPAKPGLFIYINPDDSANLPGGYEAVLEKRGLIAVIPHKAGNSRNIFERMRLALDAQFNLRKKYAVDPNRVYLSGFSGGARTASMLAVSFSDCFSGAVPLCGVNFYTQIPSGPDRHWPASYIPAADALKAAKSAGRFALITGEKDFNLANTKAVFDHGFKKEGFKKATLIEVPGLGHAPPAPEVLEQALQFVDAPPGK
jgi:poly(3-hydroxybutyrate) depolymerase